MLRHLQTLQGPGLRKRATCTNEEDMMTGEAMRDIAVQDYFGLQEGDKVFGFHCLGLLRWTFGKQPPVNPYTREPLPAQCMQRLRRCMGLREVIFKTPPWWGSVLQGKTETERAVLMLQDLDNRLIEAGFRSADDMPLTEMPPGVYALASKRLAYHLDALGLHSMALKLGKYNWVRMAVVHRALQFATTWTVLLEASPAGLRDVLMAYMVNCVVTAFYMVNFPLAF